MRSYVLVYERSTGKLESEEFGPGMRAEAFSRRASLERHVGPGIEVVVLHGDSLAALRTTHRRYFEGLQEFSTRIASST